MRKTVSENQDLFRGDESRAAILVEESRHQVAHFRHRTSLDCEGPQLRELDSLVVASSGGVYGAP